MFYSDAMNHFSSPGRWSSRWPRRFASRILARSMLPIIVLITLVLLVAEENEVSRWARAEERGANPLLLQLTDNGIDIPGAGRVTLPPPQLPDGLDQEEVRAVLEPVYRRHGWDRFTRNSQVAPFELKLGTVVDEQGERRGHTVSVWFVAHGQLELLSKSEFLEQLAADLREERATETEEEDVEALQGSELTDDQLSELGIKRSDETVFRETYLRAKFPVLNRVEVAGVAQVVTSQTPQSLVVAWQLDPRFEQEGPEHNSWRSIDRSPLGEKQLGEAQTYGGYGGYGKITALESPAGAMFVECHVVVHEPEGWFAGSNALRSKIPLGIQENVRKFRRELGRLEQ